MSRISVERKEAILKKLLPPYSMSVKEVSEEEGISTATLYHWRQQLRGSGAAVPNSNTSSEQWSAQTKLAIVAETYSMTESELSQYCREKGLFPEQIQSWRSECMQGFKSSKEQEAEAKKQAKADKLEIKELKKDLRLKEKALAETAALLVLRKKLRGLLRGRARGRLTSTDERQTIVTLILEAKQCGCRLEPACHEVQIDLRTYRRWYQQGEVQADKRPICLRPEPANKLSQQERDAIIEVCNRSEFASLPPTQIVPTLLDRGEYIASESSYYRILSAQGQLNKRGRQRSRQKRAKPTSYTATDSNQVYTWDITYLPSKVRGQHYYLYVIEDIYSRKIVGYEVYGHECGELASQLLQRTLMREQCFNQALVLHSDNGAPMKSLTFKAKMEELGITSSYSRPRVSDDNPYVESLFRTVKYMPSWPTKGFETIDSSRSWVEAFVRWYNTEHKHSKLNYVTPSERHNGKDKEILKRRAEVLLAAKELNPERWPGDIRNCAPVGDVHLNPEREAA
ncbi:IS3 family transposase [Aliivibrio sp. S3MY1]|nr:IS3 family transposase [Aliivibrio sp. S3MY1]MDD9197170.1 IS3 family transposase [Aliivibrio sp. S3MY1]